VKHLDLDPKAARALTESLVKRGAIPEIRRRFFTDPELNIGGRGKSRMQVFEVNGTKGDAIFQETATSRSTCAISFTDLSCQHQPSKASGRSLKPTRVRAEKCWTSYADSHELKCGGGYRLNGTRCRRSSSNWSWNVKSTPTQRVVSETLPKEPRDRGNEEPSASKYLSGKPS
jgi:hypothetical protein